MIALCATHHGLADAWDKSTLRKWKSQGPKPVAVRSKVQWTRDRTVFVGGGVTAIACPTLLRIRKEPIIWLTDDTDGRSLFNFTLRDREGNPAFVMQDNDWIAHPSWDDIEVPPQGRSLMLRAEQKGITLRLHFSGKAIGEILRPEHLRMIRAPSLSDQALLCEITGTIAYYDLTMTKTELIWGTNRLSNLFMGRCETALSL
jgi:hypothetical protein